MPWVSKAMLDALNDRPLITDEDIAWTADEWRVRFKNTDVEKHYFARLKSLAPIEIDTATGKVIPFPKREWER